MSGNFTATPPGIFPDIRPVTWYRDWSQNLLETTLSSTTQYVLRDPLYTQHQPLRSGLTWTQRFELTNVNSQYDWPNPPRITWYLSIEDRGNVLLPRPTPFTPVDQPNPRPVTWYQSWTISGNALTTVVQNPFVQTDWPNPLRVNWYQTWLDAGNVQLPFPTPFLQIVDSPLPVIPQPINQTWIQSLVNFFQEETFPFVQEDWPNPQRTIWYKDWYQNLLETTLAPVFQAPFNQLDWPLPETYQPIQQFWSEFGNVQLPFPTPFFQNVDSPLPIILQPIDQTWLQSLLNSTLFVQNPFRQSDWPLPRTFIPIDQFWRDNPELLLQFIQGTPFFQSDWPLPKGYPPIDQFFMVNTSLLPTPTPPPIQILSSGRQLTEKDVLRSWMKAVRRMGK